LGWMQMLQKQKKTAGNLRRSFFVGNLSRFPLGFSDVGGLEPFRPVNHIERDGIAFGE
jgi:hypothetical protein